MSVRRSVGWMRLALALCCAVTLTVPGGAQARDERTMGSGATVREFLAALDGGDIDGAMARWSAAPEVALHTGETYTTAEEVRAYFERFPRPIEVVDTLAWGGRRYEARVRAGGEALLLTFQGADGVIAYMYVEPDS